jgi:hypothetical protein
MEMNSILQNLVTVLIMLVGFIGTSLYVRGNFSARLDSDAESIKKLFLKADDLEKCKAERRDFDTMQTHMRDDFKSFKEDMRANIKELKVDIQNDINSVLKAVKTNGNK